MSQETKKRLALRAYLKSLEDSESYCEKCPVQGSCCYAAIEKSGKIYGMSMVPCKFLSKDKKCTVYNDRYEKNPFCKSIEDGILGKAVPKECLYVAGIKDYIGKNLVSIDEEKKLLLEFIKHLDPDNLPVYLPEKIEKIVKKYYKK